QGIVRSSLMHYLLPKTPFATTVPDAARHIITALTGSYVSGTYVTQRGVEDTAEDTYHNDYRAAWAQFFVSKKVWTWIPPPPAPEPEAAQEAEVQPVQAAPGKEGAPATSATGGPTAPGQAVGATEKTATAVPADASPMMNKTLPVQPVTHPVSGVPQQAPVVEGSATVKPAETPAKLATPAATPAKPAATDSKPAEAAAKPAAPAA
ncbi:hypothetical protein FRB90_004007, partial [Tulasnella sp. 427]